MDWGWEQDGNALMAYGFPGDSKYWSQMDLMVAPNETVPYDPLRMDYPAEFMPTIVGPVKRGVAEPSVGYVADLNDGGWVGLGLGVSNRAMCQVVMTTDGRLVVDGKDMPVPRREFPLTDAVKAAGKQAGNRYGVTIRIETNALAVTVRSGATNRMDVAVPLAPAVREALLVRHMALVAKDGRPRITPYFDDARRTDPDLTRPAPANRWRFAGMDRLETLYKAAWRLKDKTPGSLLKLKAEMLAAVDKGAAPQAAAVRAYEKQIGKVAQDVRDCDADQQAKALALGDLAGVFMTFEAGRSEMPWKIRLHTRLCSRLDEGVTGALTMGLQSEGTNRVVATHPRGALNRRMQTFTDEPQVSDTRHPLLCKATVELRWRGEKISLTLTQTVFSTAIPCWWTIGPFDNKGGGTVDTRQAVETGLVDLERTYAGAGGKALAWQARKAPATTGFFDEFVLDFATTYGGENVSAYAVTWVTSAKEQDATLALGSDDGVVVWLNGQRVHRNLVLRGYGSKQDQVPIRLKAGRNELRVKVMQGNGGWSLGAHLLDKAGWPLPGLTYE